MSVTYTALYAACLLTSAVCVQARMAMNIGAHRIFSITLTCAHGRPVCRPCAKTAAPRAPALGCGMQLRISHPAALQQGLKRAARVCAGVMFLTALYVSAGVCALLLVPTAVRL